MSINNLMKEQQEKLNDQKQKEYGTVLESFNREWSELGFSRTEIIYYSGCFIKICKEVDHLH